MSAIPVSLTHDSKSPFTTPEKRSPLKNVTSSLPPSALHTVARRALSFTPEKVQGSSPSFLGEQSLNLLRPMTPLSTSGSDEGGSQTPSSMITPRSPFLRELQTPTPTKRDRLGPDPFSQREHPNEFLQSLQLMSDEEIVEHIQCGCLTPQKLEPLTKNPLGANRLVHFIWLGQELSKPELLKNIASWSDDLKDQGYQVLLWTNRTYASPEFIAWCSAHSVHLVCVYQTISELDFLDTFAHFDHNLKKIPPNYGEASDILRLVLLYQLGGIYLDCDTAKKVEGRSIGIRQDFEAFTNTQNLGLKINQHGFPECNDCITSKANHPFIEHLLRQIPLSYEKSIVDLIQDFPRSYLCDSNRHWEITQTMTRTGPSFILKCFRNFFGDLSLEELLTMQIAYEGHDQTGDWFRNRRLSVSEDLEGLKTVFTSILAELEQNPHTFDLLKYATLFEKFGFVEEDRMVLICGLLELFEKKEMIDFIHVQTRREYEAVETILGKKCLLSPLELSADCNSDDESSPVLGKKSPWASPFPRGYQVEPRKSPLLSAIEHKNLDMIRFLVEERDACPVSTIYHQNPQNPDTPLVAAILKNNQEIIDYIVGQILQRYSGIEHIAGIIQEAVEADNLEIIRRMLDKNFPNEQVKTLGYRHNPLTIAKSLEVLEYLYAAGFPLVTQLGYAGMVLDFSFETYSVEMMERFIRLLISTDARLFADSDEPNHEKSKKQMIDEFAQIKYNQARIKSKTEYQEKLKELSKEFHFGF